MAILAPYSNVPDSQDILLYRGARFELLIDLDFDVTGYAMAAQLRRFRLGPKVADFVVEVVSASVGASVIRVLMATAETASLKCGEFPHHSASRYWWDVRVAGPSPSAEARYERQGEASVCAQVTRIGDTVEDSVDGGSPSDVPGDDIDGGGA
jgi:hypothetical protein